MLAYIWRIVHSFTTKNRFFAKFHAMFAKRTLKKSNVCSLQANSVFKEELIIKRICGTATNWPVVQYREQNVQEHTESIEWLMCSGTCSNKRCT